MSLDASHTSRTLQERLQAFLQDELHQAMQNKASLEEEQKRVNEELESVNKYVQDCLAQLATLGLPEPHLPIIQPTKVVKPVVSTRLDEYDPAWTFTAKISYVLRNPSRYGSPTMKGSKSITDAIAKEEPALSSNKSLHATVSSKLSRLIQAGAAVRLNSRTRTSENHFITSDWLDSNGQIKPEYLSAVEGLELPSSEEEKQNE